MSNPSKRKGTHGETAVCSYLQLRGFPACERRALSGSADKGDIAGLSVKSGAVMVEVKACEKLALSAWLAEVAKEKANAKARIGVVWHRRRGKGSPGDWFVTMSGEQFVDILKELS